MRSAPVPIYSLNTLKSIRDNFLNELKEASQGKKQSLAFIKNPLPTKSLIKGREVFQVMSVGGKVFEKALVKVENGKINILAHEKDTLPLFESGEMFFAFFQKQLSSKVNVVCLNFAYSLEPVLRGNVLDGKLLKVSKEHRFTDLLGKKVGEELENFIFQKEKKRIKVNVANDTICLILSALEKVDWKSIVGGVVGAGMNFGFFWDKKTIVNLESGDFNKFGPTETGKEIDRESSNPGEHLFEKEVSGAYLYQHFNILAKELGMAQPSLSSTKELSSLAGESESKDFSILARELLRKSASLVACQMSGIYLFKKMPKLTFVMEGSLFWEGWDYKKTVERYLGKLGVSKGGIKFLKIKNSSIFGAARLVI